MAAKRQKLDADDHGEFERDTVQTVKTSSKKTLIYIVPKKIPKARLQVLHNLARKKGFPITEQFR